MELLKHEKLTQFNNLLEELFPGLQTTESAAGTGEVLQPDWNYFHINISPTNKDFQKSEYFYNNKSVVHFSNIPALASIISERSIRLYNLHQLNDPREFTFVSKIFKLSHKEIKNAKDNLHIISFCDRSILSNKNSRTQFNMWRLYGNMGRGVALVFEVKNDPAQWVDFHMSKIIYGAKKRNRFNRLFRELEMLNQTNPKLSVDMGKLCAFHKSLMYDLEQEVRLVYDRRTPQAGLGPQTKYKEKVKIFPNIQADLFKLSEKGQDSNYLEIPIYYAGKSDYDDEIPLFRLKQIVIGYALKDEAPKIIEILSSRCSNSLGYVPEIKHSYLKKYYWDIEK